MPHNKQGLYKYISQFSYLLSETLFKSHCHFHHGSCTRYPFTSLSQIRTRHGQNQTQAHPAGRPPNSQNRSPPPQETNPKTQPQIEPHLQTIPDPTTLRVRETGPGRRNPLPNHQTRVQGVHQGDKGRDTWEHRCFDGGEAMGEAGKSWAQRGCQ